MRDPKLVAQHDAGATTLPCGCRMSTVGDAFVFEPCSPSCEYYLYALNESKRQGKPIPKLVERP